MSNEEPRLDSLFEMATAIESPKERAAFVERQCGDDIELRRQLEQLLTSDDRAGSFLENPPAALRHQDRSDMSAGQNEALPGAESTSGCAKQEPVVLGNAGQSVLKSIGLTVDLPCVSLREADGEGELPVERPGSNEISSGAVDSRYRIDGEIARGGMGAILRGRDTDLGRDLAIKVLLDEHKHHPEAIQRFIEEAQIGGQLQHPGIAPVYELGQFVDQRPFFSMKLVKGKTLSTLLLEREVLSADRSRFIGVFEHVCQTLGYAHARGVIHRDLKPSNIMVGAFGEVQVMDWGLAKVLTSGGVADEKKAQTRHNNVSVIQTRRSGGSGSTSIPGSGGSETKMGSVLGTPAYMPPEQALGEVDQLDQRTDVFGLGAILCEILTGKPPYVAKDSTALFRLASRGKLDAALERLQNCGADPELIDLTKVCLSNEPEERPRDAGVVAERVGHYLESVESKLHEAEQARAVNAARVIEQRKRLRITAVLAFAVFAVLSAGIAGTAWFASRATNNYNLAQQRAQDERDQRIRATKAERLANDRLAKEIAATQRAESAVRASRKSLYDLNHSFGLAAANSDRRAEALLWFAEAAGYAEENSHEEQACRIRHESWSESTPRLIDYFEHTESQRLQTIQYDPSGVFLATLSETGQSVVWDLRGQANALLTEPKIVAQVWHPKQPWLAMATEDQRVRVVEIASGRIIHETQSAEPVSKIAYNPDGSGVAICGKTIRLWNPEEESLTAISTAEEASVQTVSFSGDGTLVLAAYEDNHARLFDTRTESKMPMLPPIYHSISRFPGRLIVAPIFANQDRVIVTRQGQGFVWTKIDSEGKDRTVHEIWGVNTTSNSPGPGGKSLIVTEQGQGRFQIWDASRDELLAEGKNGQQVWNSAFSPDGLSVYLQSNDAIHRYRVVDGTKFGSSIQLPSDLHQFCVSPGGRQVAVADWDGRMSIWEWETYLPHYLANYRPDELSVVGRRFRQRFFSGHGTLIKPSPSGDYFLVCGSNLIFSTTRRFTLRSSQDASIVDAMDSDSLLLDACISRDERTLALANLDHEIVVWQRGDPKSKKRLVTLDAEPMRIEFGLDATSLIVLQIDGTVTCFNTLTGSKIWDRQHPEVELPTYRRQTIIHMYRRPNGYPIMDFEFYDMTMSQDGSFFATTCRNELACVWSTKDGSLKIPPVRLEEGNIEQIALSPNGRWLAIAGKTTAEVWDLATATRQERFNLASAARSLVFDSSARRLAIAVESGECTIWDWQDGQQSCPPIRGRTVMFFGKDDQWIWTDRGPVERGKREATLWSSLTGNLITSSWPMGGGKFRGIVPSSDRQTWHFPSDGSIFSILLDQSMDPRGITVDLRKRQAEILSSRRINSGKVVRLSPHEWSQRIEPMRQSDPNFFASRWEDEAVAEWHRDQRYRGLATRNLFAAQWHADELRALLGDEYHERASHQAEIDFYSALESAEFDDYAEAARIVLSIDVDQAGRFVRDRNFFGLRNWFKEVNGLATEFWTSGRYEEAWRCLDILAKSFDTQFGPGEGFVATNYANLSELCWLHNDRQRAIAYLQRSMPLDKPPVSHRWRLALMLSAADQRRAAAEEVRGMLDEVDFTESDARALGMVAQAATLVPGLDDQRTKIALDIAEAAFEAEPRFEGIDYVLGLAQLRAGKLESAVKNLRGIASKEDATPVRASIAFSALAIAFHSLGDDEAARQAIQDAQSQMPSKPSDLSTNPVFQVTDPELLCAETLLREAIRLVDPDRSSDK